MLGLCLVLFTLTTPDGLKWVCKLEWESRHIKDHISRPQCEYFFVTLSARRRREEGDKRGVRIILPQHVLLVLDPATRLCVNQLSLYNKRSNTSCLLCNIILTSTGSTHLYYLDLHWRSESNEMKKTAKSIKIWAKNNWYNRSCISQKHRRTKRTFVENSHIAISFDIY